jgi:hypothetical protein
LRLAHQAIGVELLGFGERPWLARLAEGNDEVLERAIKYLQEGN